MPGTRDQLEARLARLEARLRGCYYVGALAACGLLVAALPAHQVPGPLRTTDLRLVDSTGAVLARLAPVDGGAALTIHDAQGRVRLLLHHDSAETALMLNDTAGATRVGVAQFAHGGGGVALHGPHARGAAVLYLKERGTLTFYAEDGRRLFQVPAERE